MTSIALPERVDPTTLSGWRSAGADHRVIDVRTPAEFETVHIPGSYNVPLDLLGEHREEIARHLDDPVVLVCRSGARASQAEERLAAAGMEQVRVLDGGIAGWEAAGHDVTRGAQRWDLERQVRLAAGGLVLAGILGSLGRPRLKYLSGAVGAGLVGAALTNTCLMGNLLSRLPYNRATPSCDVNAVVSQLTGKP